MTKETIPQQIIDKINEKWPICPDPHLVHQAKRDAAIWGYGLSEGRIKELEAETDHMKKAAKDLCWQCWSMWSGFNLDTPIEEFKKRDKHFEAWWKGKSLELNMPTEREETLKWIRDIMEEKGLNTYDQFKDYLEDRATKIMDSLKDKIEEVESAIWGRDDDEFEAVIIRHNGGEWGEYAAKTIYGNYAINKASWDLAKKHLEEKVIVRPFKKAYMTVEILRPKPPKDI